MTWRAETSSLIPGRWVAGDRGLGVLGSAVPSEGADGPSILYNDLSLPADASKEVRALVLTWPHAGTLFVYEDGGFEFTGAPDGSYNFTYRLIVDGVTIGTAEVSMIIGTPSIVPASAGAGVVTVTVRMSSIVANPAPVTMTASVDLGAALVEGIAAVKARCVASIVAIIGGLIPDSWWVPVARRRDRR